MFGKLKKNLFSQFTIVSVLLIIQILLFYSLVTFLSSWRLAVQVIFYIISALVVVAVVNGKTNPSYKIVWSLLILLTPLTGGLFYLFIRLQRMSKKEVSAYTQAVQRSRAYLQDDASAKEQLWQEDAAMGSAASYMEAFANAPVYRNTAAEYLPTGEAMWARMLEELKQAEHYIFLEYFIIREGVFWNSILEILAERAAAGVDVRVIYDGIGCVTNLPADYPKTLAKLGIKCVVFNPFAPFLTVAQNNRDHRKICVVDGKVAFNGGINLADEYVNETHRFGHWKDSAVLVRGDAAWSFTVMFLQMWSFSTGETIAYEHFRPLKSTASDSSRDGYIIPYGDCPIDSEDVGAFVYLNIINSATRYLYIETPYLILDHSMTQALLFAKKRGVDVRLIVPKIPDHWYAHAVTESFCAELLEGGIEVYKYTPGFIHSKLFVCDDRHAVVGSVNLDFRSLYLHYECAAWMYKNSAVPVIRDEFLQTLECCERVTAESLKPRTSFARLLRAFLKLFAPLM